MTAYKTRGRLVWTVESFALNHAVRMYKTYFSVLHAYLYIPLLISLRLLY